MDQACEAAARATASPDKIGDRTTWDRQAWDRYVDEAVRQARLHGQEVAVLRRAADHLDHLVACVS